MTAVRWVSAAASIDLRICSRAAGSSPHSLVAGFARLNTTQMAALRITGCYRPFDTRTIGNRRSRNRLRGRRDLLGGRVKKRSHCHMIGLESQEINWVRLLVDLLPSTDLLVTEFARQALEYVHSVAESTAPPPRGDWPPRRRYEDG